MIEFYILGDMGSGNKSQLQVVNGLLKDNIHKKKTFVCGLGDNIYENGCYSVDDHQFYTKFEKPYEKIPNSIKFYMCLGNHDYGYSHTDNSEFQIQYGIKSQKLNKKWFMPSKYYHFQKKKNDLVIEFFVIYTNFYRKSKEFYNKKLQNIQS